MSKNTDSGLNDSKKNLQCSWRPASSSSLYTTHLTKKSIRWFPQSVIFGQKNNIKSLEPTSHIDIFFLAFKGHSTLKEHSSVCSRGENGVNQEVKLMNQLFIPKPKYNLGQCWSKYQTSTIIPIQSSMKSLDFVNPVILIWCLITKSLFVDFVDQVYCLFYFTVMFSFIKYRNCSNRTHKWGNPLLKK